MTNNEIGNDEVRIDFAKVMRELWHRAVIIVLAAAVFAAAAFVFSESESVEEKAESKIEYTAKALMYVKPVVLADGEESGDRTTPNADDVSAARSRVSTYTVILKSRGVLEAVIDQEGLEYSYDELYAMVSAASVAGTEFFEISVTGEDAEETARIANALADILPGKIAEVVQGDDVSVVDYAGVPELSPEIEEIVEEDASLTNRLKPAMLAALVGAVLAVVVVICLYLFGGKIHDEDYLAQAYPEVPLLAMIPGAREKNGAAPLGSGMGSAAAEAYKLLRTNLAYSFSGESKNLVVGLTSSLGDEGKSETSVNLAYTIAEAEKKVLLVEADMRVPVLAGKMGLTAAPGLSEVLSGNCEAAAAVQTFKAAGGKQVSFDVIAAGAVPEGPAELLSSERMDELVKQLRGQYDYVLLDLPSAAAVADAVAVSRIVDGMVVVVRAEQSVRSGVAETMRRLCLANANVLGFVLSGAAGGASKYYN